MAYIFVHDFPICLAVPEFCLLWAENSIVASNSRSLLFVLCTGVAHLHERARVHGQHTSTKPHSISLHLMSNHIHINRSRGLDFRAVFVLFHHGFLSLVNSALNVTIQPPSEVFEHGRTSRQDDVVVQTTASVDGALED